MPKLHTCRNCGIKYQKTVSTQTVCGFKCAVEYSKTVVEKKRAFDERMRQKTARAELREKKESIKTRSEWMKEAQQAFNAYIRERDAHQPCICCGKFGNDESWKTGGQYDAGHYLSVGSHPELRFDEANCHKQLKSCNAGAGKYARKNWTVSQEYRVRLIEKIGQDEVDRLEGPQEPKRYRIEDLKAIKAEYKLKLKQLKAR